MAKKIVIVGGVAGGASAAARLRRLDEDAEIILFERGHYISFANCGLPYYIGQVIPERSELLVQTPEAMRSRFCVDVRIDSEVTQINRAEKTVTVIKHGETYTESYDKLILSPGSTPAILPIPGVDGANVFTVWSIPDTDKVYDYLNLHAVKTAVVIGGGFVGIEMMENLVERGVQVTLVEMLTQAMNTVDYDMAQYIHQELNDHGVSLRFGEKVVAIEPAETGSLVKLGSGNSLPADLVILATGVKPNNFLAIQADLEIGPRGQIVVDACMTTSDPDIYAVGDAAEVTDFMTGGRTPAPLAGPANKEGRLVASNVLGGNTAYTGAQLTSISKVFSKTIASTGLIEKQLVADGKQLHRDYEVVLSHQNNFAGYYPGHSPLHLKVLYDVKTLRILGAEAFGEVGTDKRIDVIATAIRYQGKITDLAELELAYAPPYNTARDPVNYIGFIAENMIGGLVETILWSEVLESDMEQYQLIDVRDPDEVAEGTFEGATPLPLDELRANLSQIVPGKTALVFCRSGLRSYLAARILSQHGCPVKSIAGGWLSYETLTYQSK